MCEHRGAVDIIRVLGRGQRHSLIRVVVIRGERQRCPRAHAQVGVPALQRHLHRHVGGRLALQLHLIGFRVSLIHFIESVAGDDEFAVVVRLRGGEFRYAHVVVVAAADRVREHRGTVLPIKGVAGSAGPAALLRRGQGHGLRHVPVRGGEGERRPTLHGQVLILAAGTLPRHRHRHVGGRLAVQRHLIGLCPSFRHGHARRQIQPDIIVVLHGRELRGDSLVVCTGRVREHRAPVCVVAVLGRGQGQRLRRVPVIGGERQRGRTHRQARVARLPRHRHRHLVVGFELEFRRVGLRPALRHRHLRRRQDHHAVVVQLADGQRFLHALVLIGGGDWSIEGGFYQWASIGGPHDVVDLDRVVVPVGVIGPLHGNCSPLVPVGGCKGEYKPDSVSCRSPPAIRIGAHPYIHVPGRLGGQFYLVGLADRLPYCHGVTNVQHDPGRRVLGLGGRGQRNEAQRGNEKGRVWAAEAT